MRKIIKTYTLDWEKGQLLKELLDVQRLPELIIIEGVEDE
tara:strand:- start:539 stop:658 length:120 start_codon:yes stop_codon:yes gene_type:complete